MMMSHDVLMPMDENSHRKSEPLCSKIFVGAARDARRRSPSVLALINASIRSCKDPPKIAGCKEVRAIERAMEDHRVAFVKH